MLSLLLTIVLIASPAMSWPTLVPKFLDQTAYRQGPLFKYAEDIPGWVDPSEGGGRMLDVSFVLMTEVSGRS